MTTPSAFDALREFTAALHIRDSEACGVIARDLRAAVAEHDALRDAVRGYLATLPESERNPTCASSHLDGSVCSVIPAAVAPGDGLPVCAEFVRRHSWTRALPPRVVTLRVLAALVRP